MERFLGFISKVGHKSEEIEKAVLTALQDMDLDIQNRRGQTYDNARNMSGEFTGLQKHLQNHNKL